MPTILRVEKNTNYVILNKHALNDPNLSWKAKGLLSYLLSLPDNWQIYISELSSHATDGVDSTSSAIKELMKNGYISRDSKRKRNSKGQLANYEYVVHEISQGIENTSIEPTRENPRQEKPILDEPRQEKPVLLNNDKTNYKEEETLTGDMKEVVNKYQECISKNISDLEIKLLSDLQSKTGKELVLKAIEIAVLKNGKNLGYISTLVNDWKGKGLNTCADVDKYLAEWTTKNQKAKNNREKLVERRAEDKDYSKKASSFTDYEQRNYDFDELEKKMFGWNTEDSMH